MIAHPWIVRRPWTYNARKKKRLLPGIPTFSGIATLTISNMTIAATATFEGEYTATAILVISTMILAGVGTAYTSLSEGQAGLVITAMEFDGLATFTDPVFPTLYLYAG